MDLSDLADRQARHKTPTHKRAIEEREKGKTDLWSFLIDGGCPGESDEPLIGRSCDPGDSCLFHEERRGGDELHYRVTRTVHSGHDSLDQRHTDRNSCTKNRERDEGENDVKCLPMHARLGRSPMTAGVTLQALAAG